MTEPLPKHLLRSLGYAGMAILVLVILPLALSPVYGLILKVVDVCGDWMFGGK